MIKGDFYDVECAVDAQGQAPAAQFLDELKKGVWDGDPSDTTRPSDEQVHDYDVLLVLLRHFVRHAEPPYAKAVNYLQDGIWEFKFNNKRVTFFDTDGRGGYTPKAKITNRGDAVEGADYWWFPDFDRAIRLGHCFTKDGQLTRPEDIRKAIELRQEDLSHDQDT